MKQFYLFAVLLILNTLTISALPENECTWMNDKIRFIISNEQNRIKVISIYDKSNKKEFIPENNTTPLFEFIINNKKVTALDPVWTFQKTEHKKLANGGTQIDAIYEGTEWLKGLEITVQWQSFPGSTLIRERIRLRAINGKKFWLNNLNGKNHFIYPQYKLNLEDNNQSIVTEIRMGSYGQEILPDFDPQRTYDDRSSRNLATCHMFHTVFTDYKIENQENILLKGPFAIIQTPTYKAVTTYEHASQDYASEQFHKSSKEEPLIDASQGVKGERKYIPTDQDYWFIGTRIQKQNQNHILSQNILRGGYLEKEQIPSTGYYETVWSTLHLMPAESDHLAAIKKYLLYQITEHLLSRKINFYYNTWGMQRDAQTEGLDMREVFQEKRILEEIDYAAELNVDLIVLDDGWQETMGIWTPNQRKLPNGIKLLLERMHLYGIKPGAWLSLMGIDSTTTRYKGHRDWVIRDAKGEPIAAQWDHPAFDLVGDFYDIIKEDHIKLIDMGFRYFKWDAINTFHSDLPGLHHGDKTYTKKEIIDRYNYLLPIYVVKLMRELREYHPEVVVELDLTEPERAMVGLIGLQEGKLFWMNNGASGYGDYSTYRTKSMRNIINQAGDLLPPEILTYAEYPHNTSPYDAQRYHINSTLVAGHGVWGNLSRMSSTSRRKAGDLISKSKKVLPLLHGTPLQKTGLIGSTPEIYQQINEQNGFGQIIGFSGSATEYTQETNINTKQVLGILNHAYQTTENKLILNMQFTMPDDTREAFILGNENTGISILSSTGWLNNIKLEKNTLTITPGTPTTLQIRIPEKYKSISINVPYEQQTTDVYKIEVSAIQPIQINLSD